jgi:hypothetical protein
MASGNGNGTNGIAVKLLFGVAMILVGSIITSWSEGFRDDSSARDIEEKIDLLSREFRQFKEGMIGRLAALEVQTAELVRQERDRR